MYIQTMTNKRGRSRVVIYTDGACSGNPGPGGWGAIIIEGMSRREISGYQEMTTNNRMEMTAAIRGLAAIEDGSSVQLFTDSEYLKKGITEWIVKWQRNGWRTANGEVKNRDLWEQLLELVKTHNVDFEWIRGHQTDEMNKQADMLARKAITDHQKSSKKKDGI